MNLEPYQMNQFKIAMRFSKKSLVFIITTLLLNIIVITFASVYGNEQADKAAQSTNTIEIRK